MTTNQDPAHFTTTSFSQRPVVVCFSGLDPSGGAGIQADIESLNAAGCHPAPIITCVTAQNTQQVHSWHPIAPGMLSQQFRMIAQDMPISAIKIGMIGTFEALEVIENCLRDHPTIPVILDPIISSGSGQQLAQYQLHTQMLKRLIPLTTLVTPNSDELEILIGHSVEAETGAFHLLGLGCTAVAVTGGHYNTTKVRNRLWQDYQLKYDRSWNRIAGQFHGTGCTFSASAAGFIGQGMTISQAVLKADEFCWQAISKAERPGQGQLIPHRTFWLNRSPRRSVCTTDQTTH